MYDPSDNSLEKNLNQNENTQPAAPGYGTQASPYTAQTNPGTGTSRPVQEPSAPDQGTGTQPSASQPGVGRPAVGEPSVTYRTGPVHTGSAYIPPQGGAPYGVPQGQPAAQPPHTAYTWNPQAVVPQQPSYYTPVKPPKQKKPQKQKSGKFALKLLAAVLCCAVVSLGSVGAFAALIQNGVVNVESKGGANKTAAFTLYKQAEETVDATSTVTVEGMTAQEVAKKLIPSVVCVQNYQITQQGGYYFGDFFGYDYGSEQDDDSGMSPAGEGSGIIVSKDGYIVTNQHVVDGATNLKVVTSEGLTYEAELVGEDTQTDLAVVKIDTEDELTPAEFGSSGNLEVADEVMAIGNPGGLQLNSSVTFGRVSALNRQITNSDSGYTMACIQTDAAINPGNSGGALVDMNGHVVGINSSKIVDTSYEGLGFAIPSDTVQPIVSDLMEYGYVKDRAATGFSGQYIERLRASWYGMNPGYYVTQVTSKEASEAGLQRGDMITAIDDTQVTSNTTIANYIADKKPGDIVTLTVDRSALGGGSEKLEMALSENTGKSSGEGRNASVREGY